MMKKVKLFAIGIGLLAAGCSSDKNKHEGLYFGNDFEAVAGWIPNQTQLVKGDAHSGNYCIKVDSSIEFGQTFTMHLKDISSKPIKKITVSVYCMFKAADAKAALVVSVDSPENVNLLYSGTKLQDVIKDADKWEKISVDIDLSTGKEGANMPNNIVKIYVWNNNKKVVLSDDYEIEFFE